LEEPRAPITMLPIPRKASNDASMFPATTARVGAAAAVVEFAELLTTVELATTDVVVVVAVVRQVDVDATAAGVGVGVGLAEVVGAAPLPYSQSPYSVPSIDGSKNA